MKALFGLAALGLMIGGAGRATAGPPVYYTSDPAFQAAATNLATQVFSTPGAIANVGPGGVGYVDNPLNTTTNNLYFAPGDIKAGLTITASTNVGSDLAIAGPNFAGAGNANYSLFTNYGGSLNFAFQPGTTAASLNVLSVFGASDVSVSLYSPTSALLGTYTIPGASSAGTFFGVTTSTDIGSISISAPSGPFVGVDQVRFGSAAVPEASTLLGMGGLVLGGGLLALRRRR